MPSQSLENKDAGNNLPASSFVFTARPLAAAKEGQGKRFSREAAETQRRKEISPRPFSAASAFSAFQNPLRTWGRRRIFKAHFFVNFRGSNSSGFLSGCKNWIACSTEKPEVRTSGLAMLTFFPSKGE